MPILGSSGSQSGRVPGVPTSVSASAGNGQATVSFTVPAYAGKGGTVSYTATSSPGNFTASGASSPLTVTGLSNGTSYTFTVSASVGGVAGSASSASAGVSPINPPTVTGGTLSSDATYYYRTFTANGTLVVSDSTLTCDVLIGAGGGAGGSGAGSGGGSFTSNYSATAGSYNFVIGAAGNDSTGIEITAYKGGNSVASGNGLSGGSGGGGGISNNSSQVRSGGAATKASGGTITYGNAGGTSQATVFFTGSGGGGGWGGGGGGGPEDAGEYSVGGAAGPGINTYNSWSLATGIGQLSGGTRWVGGGNSGTGQVSNPNGPGVGVNTAGAGSSGFVMVRYLRSAVGG